jgi:High potential iron-sulfur protein
MSKITRRELTLGGITAGLTAALWSVQLNAAPAAAPLDPNDPTAKALGFVTDARKVDAAANPTFKAAQNCASCAQYQGKASDSSAPCSIFPGKTVPAAGWCKVWVQRPAG